MSITEESARLIIKEKKAIFGDLVNIGKKMHLKMAVVHQYYIAVIGSSWKENLYNLELIEKRMIKIAAGSYQNIFTAKGYMHVLSRTHMHEL